MIEVFEFGLYFKFIKLGGVVMPGFGFGRREPGAKAQFLRGIFQGAEAPC